MTVNSAAGVVKLALLIDGENITATFMPLIMREAAKLGTIAIRRVYGHMKTPRMKAWEEAADQYGLTKVNVSPLTKGKNAADMKLAVEAMDMLHGQHPDVFCIASSDGDFTSLVQRIRCNALSVYGFGAKKAPAGYQAEFDHFFPCDTLLAAEKKNPARPVAAPLPKQATPAPAPARAAPRQAPAPRATVAPPSAAQPAPRATQAVASTRSQGPRAEIPTQIVQAVLKIVQAHNGSASFRDIGNELPAEVPKFKSRTYGFSTTKALLKALQGKHGLDVTKGGQVLWRRARTAFPRSAP